MTGDVVLDIVGRLEGANIKVWLDGGWAVDAVLGTQRRRHDDLDLVVDLRQVTRLARVLGHAGYELARGEPPKSIELVDGEGRQVDVHPVSFTPTGDGLYRMDDGGNWVYPAAGFAGHGRISGRSVRCLTPAVQVLCHTGYEPHLDSYDDVQALCARFGLAVPEQYRRSRNSYGPHRVD